MTTNETPEILSASRFNAETAATQLETIAGRIRRSLADVRTPADVQLSADGHDGTAWTLADAMLAARRELAHLDHDVVALLRGAGVSWKQVGTYLGTTGSAAQQRFGR